jgi:hypothetical protein
LNKVVIREVILCKALMSNQHGGICDSAGVRRSFDEPSEELYREEVRRLRDAPCVIQLISADVGFRMRKQVMELERLLNEKEEALPLAES